MTDPSPGSSPTSTTTLEDEQLVDLPGFHPTSTSRPADPLPPGSTTGTTSSGPGLDDVDEWDDVDEGDRPPRPATGSTRASSPVDIAALAEITHTIVALASVVVRFVRTRRRRLPDHLWLADEHDQAAIGDPLARIAARHAPVTGGDAGDVADGLAIVAGGAAYAIKNVTAEADAGEAVDVGTIPEPDGQ